MLLGTRNKTNQCKDEFKLSIDDTEVKEVSTCKFLGITVDQNLTWKNHVDDLAKKCFRSIGILYTVKQFLPESALLSLYYTLLLSHIKMAYARKPCGFSKSRKEVGKFEPYWFCTSLSINYSSSYV